PTSLDDRLTGRVVRPRDPDYAQAAAAWNVAWTPRPPAVVVATSEDDVVAAVTHARGVGLGVAVQSTGHGVTVPADEHSLLVALHHLDHVRVEPAAGTATVGGGVRWAPVLAEAQRFGLAPLVGSAPHVGAVRYSLGGGFGWLARRYGLAVDSIRTLRVVLADGSVVPASAQQNPELFWGMCGSGGSSLGVVVQMTVELFPVDEVYAGSLLYPAEAATEVFERFREMDAGEDFTGAFNITAFPPLEIVPEPIRGKAFAIVRGCHVDPAAGARLVDEWRAWRAPALDMFGVLPFSRAGEISQDPVDPLPAATNGRWLARLGAGVGGAMRDAVLGGEGPSPVLFAETRQAGGAAARPNPAVSFEARDGQYALEMVSLLVAPGADQVVEDIYRRTWDRLADDLAPLPGYLNFAEGQDRVASAALAFTPATRERLAALKRSVDPGGVFRHGI
ncbi:MAG: FAD-binding oxidoreductase, partial [Actinomycetota bacterium]